MPILMTQKGTSLIRNSLPLGTYNSIYAKGHMVVLVGEVVYYE